MSDEIPYVTDQPYDPDRDELDEYVRLHFAADLPYAVALLAGVIQDAIEAEPHHRRLYPDLYAARVAERVLEFFVSQRPESEEATT